MGLEYVVLLVYTETSIIWGHVITLGSFNFIAPEYTHKVIGWCIMVLVCVCVIFAFFLIYAHCSRDEKSASGGHVGVFHVLRLSPRFYW